MVPLFLLACNRPLASALVSSLGVPGHLHSGTVPLLDNCWAVPAGLEPFSAAGTIQARATALTGGVLQRAHVALFLLDARWGTSERPTAQGRHPQPRRGCFHLCYAGCALLPAAALACMLLRHLALLLMRGCNFWLPHAVTPAADCPPAGRV